MVERKDREQRERGKKGRKRKLIFFDGTLGHAKYGESRCKDESFEEIKQILVRWHDASQATQTDCQVVSAFWL